MLIAWVCHVCQMAYETSGGGVCAECRKPACKTHLRKRKDRDQVTYLCPDCFLLPALERKSK
jgi:hypothetical protein